MELVILTDDTLVMTDEEFEQRMQDLEEFYKTEAFERWMEEINASMPPDDVEAYNGTFGVR